MRKLLLSLLTIAVFSSADCFALLGVKKSGASSQSSGTFGGAPVSQSSSSSSTRSAPSTSSIPTSQLTKEQIDSVTEIYSGMSQDEVDDFLSKTKNMNADELQDYVRSMQTEKVTVVEKTVDDEQLRQIAFEEAVRREQQYNKNRIKQEQNKEAFQGLLEDVLPLSPAQIKKLHKYYDLTLKAKAETPSAPPTPNFTSIPVYLDPGSQAPVIRLSAGFVSSLLFVDRTGAPWPIEAYSIGDSKNFNIQWDSQSNALFVQATKRYVHANMAVRLVNLNTPVMLTLVSGQRDVDFRVDLQLQSRGPEALPPVAERLPYSSEVNADMINMLDGIPPVGSLKLYVENGPGQAWKYKNKVYFRSKLTLLSPAWTATVSSPDGTHVYELMPTPFLLASKEGRTLNIRLRGV